MMNENQIKEKIRELEKELTIYKYVLETPRADKIGRPRGTLKYSTEQLIFLNECEKQNMSDIQIINAFNSKFGTMIKTSSRQLYNLMVREGIKKLAFTQLKGGELK